MKKLYALTSAAAVVLAFSAMPAQAGDRDRREYTKSVRIGGDIQSAHGTACMQPDGSWELVSFNGHDRLYDEIAQEVYVTNTVRPVYYYSPYPVYRPAYRPVNVFSFSWGDHDRNRRDYRHRGRDNWRHDDRGHGRHDDHDRGRGRGHHR